MSTNVVIIDCQVGNIHSVSKKMHSLQAKTTVSSDCKIIQLADKLILPGVGHFQNAMQNLTDLHLIELLNELVLVKKKPILGICLGMQLFAKKSEEGNSFGLGWIDAEVKRFDVQNTLKYKVPHTGWNQIIKKKESVLMHKIPDLSEFYFVHSYHYMATNKTNILTETDYEYRFVSAIEKDNIFGVQYHPEKSHDIGTTLLANFLHL